MKQNKKNIKDSLTLTPIENEVFNLHNDKYLKYSKTSGTVGMSCMTKEMFQEAREHFELNGISEESKGGCPFGKTVSQTQKKVLLIEHFEFFDRYMLKILAQYFD